MSGVFTRRLSANQKVWGAIGGVIVAGTAFKVGLILATIIIVLHGGKSGLAHFLAHHATMRHAAAFPHPYCFFVRFIIMFIPYYTSRELQIGYFRYCRDILSDHSDKSHLIATEHYREAKEFAKWSSQDRAEKRAQLPPLTPEQEKQMKAYLRMMQGRCKFLLVFPPPLPGSDAPMVLLTHNFAPPTPIPPLPP